MIIFALTIMISIIPSLLGIMLLQLYGRTKLIFALLLYLLFSSVWQIDMGILYSVIDIPKPITLFIFKLLSFGKIMLIPSVLYIAYTCVNEYHLLNTDNFKFKILSFFVNKKSITVFYVWSFLVYIINWTPYGLINIDIYTSDISNISYYFPVYGKFGILIFIHTIFYFTNMLLVYIAYKHLADNYVKKFILTYMVYSTLIYLFSVINFVPYLGFVISSIGVLLNSSTIIFSFMKMYNYILISHSKMVGRQNKLTYIGEMNTHLVHEIKNLLSLIKGYSQILPMTQKLNEDATIQLDFITTASNQMDGLVKNYQHFIKSDNIDFELTNVGDLIDKSLKILNDKIIENNILINYETKKIYAEVNPTYLSQVIFNLIKNGIEAIPADKDNKEIKIELSQNNNIVIIDINDNGSGIPKSMWKEIFSPFHNSTKETGMGVGLSFCNKIIFEHKGTIKVVDSNQDGTNIQIKLPTTATGYVVEDEEE
jgi:signal transduction histidine kinase